MSIHQIFINMDRGDLFTAGRGRYYQSHLMTKKYCEDNGYTYRLWNETDLDTLSRKALEGKYKLFYNQMRHPIQKVDFAKYIILYCFGGIYLDLDISIIFGKSIHKLFRLNPLIVRWNNSHLPYNAILGCHQSNPLFLAILNQCQRDYLEKSQIYIYHKWIGRFVFQTTGHYMLQRALKKFGIKKSDYQNILHIKSKGKEIIAPDPIFLDTNESVWYGKI